MIPDFTQGDAIPANAKHDSNLGPTGLRGWMFCDNMVTSDARQVVITRVEKGSPADSVFLVGDVILGVGGKPFSYDPRAEFGQAITLAETAAGGGGFTVTRWREGKAEEVVVTLPVLGSYGATAPYDCPKSKRILDRGCKALAVVRARYDTKRKTHPVGEEVFVICRADLPHFLSSRSPVDTKLQPFILQHELDLASATAISVTLQHRVRRPLAPINLRVKGDGPDTTRSSGPPSPSGRGKGGEGAGSW